MADNIIQHSFSAGELAPSLLARTDIPKYKDGAAVMRNFFVDHRSGASTRPGFEFCNHCVYGNYATRLIPYQLSADSTFVIEFGHEYCRFYTNGAPVLEGYLAISMFYHENPAWIDVPGHSYTAGQSIYITGTGVPQLDGRMFTIGTVSGIELELYTTDGHPVDGTGYGAYTANNGSVARVYTINSQYSYQDLALLKFFQLQSVMTLVHPSYPVTTLQAVAYNNWFFSSVSFGTTVPPPNVNYIATTSGGSTFYSYVVTAVDINNQESVASNPGNIANAVNISATAGTITLGWDASSGAVQYNIYKAEPSFNAAPPSGAAYGFVGSVTGTQFTDSNIVPDFSQSPPVVKNPFANNNYPGCGCYFQQRAYYAGSTQYPTTFWASQPGIYNNFNTSDPVVDSDAITGTLVSLQINAIKSMLPMPSGLVLLTAAGAWVLSSGQGGLATTSAVTPGNATATPQAYNGASYIPPIVVNYDILYVQSKGSIVRDLSYNIYANIYTGADISIMSNHLFFNYTITEWAWAEEPWKIVWIVRTDGDMLSLTYVKEQEMIGWAHHDTAGLFKSCCTVREGNLDVLYVVVQRQIQGQLVQMIERMSERIFDYGVESAFCVDAGKQTALWFPQTTLTLSSQSGPVTCSSDQAVFSSGWAGGVIIRADGGIIRVTGYISSIVVTGVWLQPPLEITEEPEVEAFLPPYPPGQWSAASPNTIFYGLDHLEGQTVSILADGVVQPQQVVTNGKITLTTPATNVIAGLPYSCQLKTMYLDAGEPTIQGKRKALPSVSIRALETRGVLAGRTWNTLTPVKDFNSNIVQPGYWAPPLVTGDAYFKLDPLYDVPGQVCMQVNDPVPATILGIIPEVVVGDTSGGAGGRR